MSDRTENDGPQDLTEFASDSAAAFDALLSESSRQIGPYRLLQEIGVGGMGAVWLAEQEKPVRRRVAVKLIKAGRADKQIIARFEAERQALSMMDHPHIAKVRWPGRQSIDDRRWWNLTNSQPDIQQRELHHLWLNAYWRWARRRCPTCGGRFARAQ